MNDCCCSPSSENDWKAECDARTLRDAVCIMKDSGRKEKAMAALKKMAKEEEEEKQAMQDLIEGKVKIDEG